MLNLSIRNMITTNGNSALEEQTILLKNQQNEIEGGIATVILYDRLYITKFWLSHQLRGFSYGSILLNEVGQYAIDKGIQSIEMGTNYKYIKTILLNNQFQIKSDYHTGLQQNATFYSKSLVGFEKQVFKHHHQVEGNPTDADLIGFTNAFFQEVKHQLKEYLAPCYIYASNQEEEVAIMMGYLQNKNLYIDHYWLSTHYQTFEAGKELLKCFEQYAFEHQIKAVYIEDVYQDSKEFYLNHGFEALPDEPMNQNIFKKILIA
jgi:hypothetical protein